MACCEPTSSSWHLPLAEAFLALMGKKRLTVLIWPISGPFRCSVVTMWKPTGEKICFCLDLFQTAYFIRTKVPQSVLVLVILLHFCWKLLKTKQKKVPHHLWNQVTPPPHLEKFFKQKQKRSSNSLELGNPPLSEKIPNVGRKVPQSVWNQATPPLTEKCPSINRTKKFLNMFGFEHEPPLERTKTNSDFSLDGFP